MHLACYRQRSEQIRASLCFGSSVKGLCPKCVVPSQDEWSVRPGLKTGTPMAGLARWSTLPWKSTDEIRYPSWAVDPAAGGDRRVAASVDADRTSCDTAPVGRARRFAVSGFVVFCICSAAVLLSAASWLCIGIKAVPSAQALYGDANVARLWEHDGHTPLRV